MAPRDRRSVQLAQVNFQYGTNVFVPYSVGSLQAYALSVPEIKENFEFQNPLFRRDDPETVVGEMEEPAVFGLSCYLWNWEYNKALAQAVRSRFPKALVVFGGEHVPDRSEGFFLEHPYVDILVHKEGEFAFAEILIESLSEKPDYTKIEGLSVRVRGNATEKTLSRGRMNEEDLKRLPSPYLSGVFDFMLGGDYTLNVSQETNRGCPYTCTFCDWGGSNYSKVYKMSEERLAAEFEWFGEHRIEYIFNCDANYGIFPRDVELTKKMIEVRERHQGFPKKFRMCTAKNSNDRIFEIVTLLDAADMNKGATLSFQSMDAHTLEIVERSNIKIEKFSELMDRYKEVGIATYTELIMGMPGETYESTKRGIDTLFDEQADSVNLYVYVCTMLPNSHMSFPAYVKEHGIEAVRMPVLLAHSTPEPESLSEYTDIIIGTAAMPREDWVRTFMFYWAIQGFHCLGLTQQIAIFFHKEYGIAYSDFYERLLEYFADRSDSSPITGEIAVTKRAVRRAMEGGRLDRVMPEFGEIYWPLEEASFLNFIVEKWGFYDEIETFLRSLVEEKGLSVDPDLLRDLVSYQAAIMIDPVLVPISIELAYDFPNYFKTLGESSALEQKPVRLVIEGNSYHGDQKAYAREVVWYGRKGGSFHHKNIEVTPL
ncbi:MAG: hypothetical protein JWN50_424 [Parcubacteria group bacterium]|nr:hypothetical protein [Parcubacteria group bacterium]